mmetsp:Transcript_27600/g.59438  ORF Transcript_27600/g.59438 Transcript_27600/m.59438 type:complete len:97 (-) Transcript_27600:746-1036(-)
MSSSKLSNDPVLFLRGVPRPAGSISLGTVYCVFHASTKQLELQKVQRKRLDCVETHWREQPDPPSACLDQSCGLKDVRRVHCSKAQGVLRGPRNQR